MRRFLLLCVIGLVVAGFAPGAAASHTGLQLGAGSRVTVTMTEYRFTPATITLEAGQAVDIIVENKGILGHVLMVYPAPKTPFKSATDWWEYAIANTYFQRTGEILVHNRGEFVVGGTHVSEISLEPGKTVRLTFIPQKKGVFEMGCHATGHYQAGMKGTLIVK